MKQCCPNCGFVAGLAAFANEAEARECLALALKWPAPLADALVRYMQLFRPPKRALAWSRAYKLMRELHDALDAGCIERHGRTWAAPRPAWEPALRAVTAKRDELTLPLKDHAYLYEILCRQANKVEAKAEQKTEVKRRTRRPDTPRPDTPRPAQPERAASLPPGGIQAAAARFAAGLRSDTATIPDEE